MMALHLVSRRVVLSAARVPGVVPLAHTFASKSGDDKPLWIATQEGHHPQSALTAGKLHRRLEDYEARNAARFAGRN